MRWKKLFTPVENFDAEDAKKFMRDHREGTYTLLDVRQPKEYEESHIPGAKLIPLPELTDRLDEVDADQPVIAYCAVGGRSRAAAQLLAGKGFDAVYNLKGGIKAYNGETAVTPVALGEIHLRGNESLQEVVTFIHAMEAGLETFYSRASESIADEKVSSLLKRLAAIEARHKDRLVQLYVDLDPEHADNARFQAGASAGMMEGGFDMDGFLNDNRKALQRREGVLDIAMMLETHGLDLYLRYAQQARDEDAKTVLYTLADEEKAHLSALGRLIERADVDE